MKILFLDVDGVLNKDSTKERFNGFTGLDAKLLRRFLIWWQNNPGVELVLSSTWRTDDLFKKHLNDNGISWIGETPVLYVDRGLEILQWINNNYPLLKRWAVLDDIQVGHVGHRLVQTSPIRGVEEKHLRRIETLLNAS